MPGESQRAESQTGESRTFRSQTFASQTKVQRYRERAAEFRVLADMSRLESSRAFYEDLVQRYEGLAAKELQAATGD
jgi:hypothetical protein